MTGRHGGGAGGRQRRRLLQVAAASLLPAWAGTATAAPGAAAPSAGARAGGPAVDVWKSPSCGCCQDWVRHLEAHGFVVTVHDVGNTAMRTRLGIPTALGSCHTARVAGYALEGHVPAREVLRLLRERPMAIGLAVPGMPVGSPGMDGPDYGSRRDPYDVLLVARDGSTRPYASYR